MRMNEMKEIERAFCFFFLFLLFLALGFESVLQRKEGIKRKSWGERERERRLFCIKKGTVV